MNWSSLLPSTYSPLLAIRRLSDADHAVATHALRDLFIHLALFIALFFGVVALWQTFVAWRRVRPYSQITRAGAQASQFALTSSLPLFRELRHHLIEFSFRDGTGGTSKRRTVEAAEVFREADLAPAFSSSRLMLAIPGILTGCGVLGTFVGLQLGIGGLNLNDPGNLNKSIVPLIEGCAVAFSSSVWGVAVSVIFSLVEKSCEGFVLRPLRKIQIKVDETFARYVPEEAMYELERSSRGTEDLLKGLAVAIGSEMQQAIGRLGAEIRDAVSSATAEGHGPLMEKSAELLSSALTAELASLKEQIGTMADQFSERFNGASDGLQRSVQDFQPAVAALSGVVSDAQSTVAGAVARLNAHDTVMQEMVGAAANVRSAAEAFNAMNDTLGQAAVRNEEAARAQLSAARSNERATEQFSRVGDGLLEMRQTLESAAVVVGSLGGPLSELHVLLAAQPEVQRQFENTRATSESERSQMLLAMSGDLAEKVGIAAQQFARVSDLADKLSASATSLDEASSELAAFGQQVLQASKDQRDAAEASRAAAATGERAARAFEPLPAALTALTGGLASAGASVREGAESTRDSYRELVTLQEKWFEGIKVGLNGMKDQLQTIIQSYGQHIDGQTTRLMQRWTTEVESCLSSYSSQVDEIAGGLEELQAAIREQRP